MLLVTGNFPLPFFRLLSILADKTAEGDLEGTG